MMFNIPTVDMSHTTKTCIEVMCQRAKGDKWHEWLTTDDKEKASEAVKRIEEFGFRAQVNAKTIYTVFTTNNVYESED